MVFLFGGRESISNFSHTNEFCGKSKVATEGGGAKRWVKVGRCTYERGKARALRRLEGH
jgi:hypothetical protein